MNSLVMSIVLTILEHHGKQTCTRSTMVLLSFSVLGVRTRVVTLVPLVPWYTCTIITLSQKRLEIQALRCNGRTYVRTYVREYHAWYSSTYTCTDSSWTPCRWPIPAGPRATSWAVTAPERRAQGYAGTGWYSRTSYDIVYFTTF